MSSNPPAHQADSLRHAPLLRRNVGRAERWLSLVAGGTALAQGMRRGGLSGALLGAGGGYLLFRGVTGHCALYRLLRIRTTSANERSLLGAEEIRLSTRMHVFRPPHEVYRYWRQLENLPRFMRHLKSVTVDGNRSHWIARGPLGLTLSWDSQIVHDTPNERLAWRSVPGSRMDTRGEVRFKPTRDGGTLLEVEMYYRPSAGAVVLAAARWFGGLSEKMLRRDLNDLGRALEMRDAEELGPITAAHA